MVVAHGPVGLPADDSRHLRDAVSVSVACFPQPTRTLEPHLVHHGVVQRCARRNHGGYSPWRTPSTWDTFGATSSRSFCVGAAPGTRTPQDLGAGRTPTEVWSRNPIGLKT